MTGKKETAEELLQHGVFIRFDDIRSSLKGASKKQVAALFLAILDYAETGKEPQRKPKDPFSAWVLTVFPKIKARIDEDGGGESGQE